MVNYDKYPNDLVSAWEKYINTYMRNQGVTVDSPPELQAEVLRNILSEVEGGMTITPNGDVVYLSDNAPSSSQNGEGASKGLATADEKKKTLLVYGGGSIAVILLLVMGLWLMNGGLSNLSNPFSKATPTPIVTEEPLVDYQIVINSLDGNASASYDVPKSMNYNGKDFVINPSSDKSLKSGDVWCKLPETPYIGCWVQGSIINTVLGMKYSTYETEFQDAVIGQKIVVTSGQRDVTYTISDITTVNFTDTSVFSQNSPALTLVFFDQLDEKSKPVGAQERQVIIARPDQDSLVAQVSSSSTEDITSVDYVGSETPITIGGKAYTVSQRVILANEAGTYLKVSYYFRSIEGATQLSALEGYTYTLDTGLKTDTSAQVLDSANSWYQITFIVPNLTNSAQSFSLDISNGTKTTVMNGTINMPSAMENVSIKDDSLYAEFQPSSKTLVVHMNYSMVIDAPAETCKNCNLVVNGSPILPNSPVVFSPTGQTQDISYTVNVNVGNLSGIQFTIGNKIYALDLYEPTVTPTPSSATATPTPGS